MSDIDSRQYAEGYAAGRRDGYDQGIADGVKAARGAVAAIEHWTSYTPDDSPWECFASDPLAAIHERELRVRRNKRHEKEGL